MVTFIPSLCIICYVTGDVKLFDTDTYSEVHSLSDLGCVNSVCVTASGGTMGVGVASYTSHLPPPQFEEVTSSMVTVLVMGGVGGWEESHLSLPRDNKVLKSDYGRILVTVPPPGHEGVPSA